jgi:hypothetical protein
MGHVNKATSPVLDVVIMSVIVRKISLDPTTTSGLKLDARSPERLAIATQWF